MTMDPFADIRPYNDAEVPGVLNRLLDDPEFIEAMTQGVRPDGTHSFPAFPYVYFNRVRTDDLKDMWAYLRAIPPIEKENLGNTLPFPFDVRLGQLGWKLLFF